MEFIKKAVRVGNSAGVILPRKLLGADIKVTVINRPFNLKKVVFRLLSPFLQDIIGIYVLSKKPLEVLAVSSSTKEKLEHDKLALNIIPLPQLRKDLQSSQILRQNLFQAETIMNKSLLDTLKSESKKKVITRL